MSAPRGIFSRGGGARGNRAGSRSATPPIAVSNGRHPHDGSARGRGVRGAAPRGAHRGVRGASRGRGSKLGDQRGAATASDLTSPTTDFAGALTFKSDQSWRQPENAARRDYKAKIQALWEALRKQRVVERKQAIKDGKVSDPEQKMSLSDATKPVGTCTDKCAEWERIFRIHEGNVLWPEKTRLESGEMVPDESKMVKRFQRAAAGDDAQLPSDLRPPGVLQSTLDYLIDTIIGGTAPMQSVQEFIWDRTRAIRNDFSIQQLTKTDDVRIAISCFERITRYHIFALHDTARDGIKPGVDHKQEVEQLTNTITSLFQYYEDSRGRVQSVNEPEFRAYYIIREIGQTKRPDLESRVMQWPLHIIQHPRVRVALKLYEAACDVSRPVGPLDPMEAVVIARANGAAFWTVIDSPAVSYLTACCAENYFRVIRDMTMTTIWKACKRFTKTKLDDLSLNDLMLSLGFDNEDETQEYCESQGFQIAEREDGQAFLDIGSIPTNQIELPGSDRVAIQAYNLSMVETKRHGRTASAVINGFSIAQARAEGLIHFSEDEDMELEERWPAPSRPVQKFSDKSPQSLTAANPPQLNDGGAGKLATTSLLTSDVAPAPASSLHNPFAPPAPDPGKGETPPGQRTQPPLSNAEIASKVFATPSHSIFAMKANSSPSIFSKPPATSSNAGSSAPSLFSNPFSNPFAPPSQTAESSENDQSIPKSTGSDGLFTKAAPPANSTPSLFTKSPFSEVKSDNSSTAGASQTSFPPISTTTSLNPFTKASDPAKSPSSLFARSTSSNAPRENKIDDSSKKFFSITSDESKAPGEVNAPPLFASNGNGKPSTEKSQGLPASTPDPAISNPLPSNSTAESVLFSSKPAPGPAGQFSNPFAKAAMPPPTSQATELFANDSLLPPKSITTTTEPPSLLFTPPANVQSLPQLTAPAINSTPLVKPGAKPETIPEIAPADSSKPKAEAMPNRPTRDELLDRLVRTYALESNGLLQQFIENEIAKTVRSCIRTVNREKERAHFASARRFLLSRKFVKRWRNVVWKRKLKTMARQRRSDLRQSLQDIALSSRATSRAGSEMPGQSGHVGGIASATKSVKPESQAVASMAPPIKPALKIGHQASLPAPESRFPDDSHIDTAGLPRKRMKLASSRQANALGKSAVFPDTNRINKGSRLQRLSPSLYDDNKLINERLMKEASRIVGGRTDTTRTDYFKLKALGLDPDTPAIPRTKKRRIDPDNDFVARKSRPSPSKSLEEPVYTSHHMVANAGVVRDSAGLKRTTLASSTAGDEEDNELFAQIQAVKKALSETESWYRDYREQSDRTSADVANESEKQRKLREWRPSVSRTEERWKRDGLPSFLRSSYASRDPQSAERSQSLRPANGDQESVTGNGTSRNKAEAYNERYEGYEDGEGYEDDGEGEVEDYEEQDYEEDGYNHPYHDNGEEEGDEDDEEEEEDEDDEDDYDTHDYGASQFAGVNASSSFAALGATEEDAIEL